MDFLVILWFVMSLLVLFHTVNVTQGLARFIQVPPSVLYVSKGKTARFVWDYNVDNITTEFEESSPIWYFYNENNTEDYIGYESEFEGRKWMISKATCPQRLLNPIRVSKESNATLVIRNVSKSDNGVYGCSLMLMDLRPMTSRVLLVVTSTPKFNTRGNVSSRSITEGQNLSINCSATGDPTPNITWLVLRGVTKEIKSQGLGSTILTMQNITRNESGRYECQANNNPNELPVIWEIIIHVNFTSKPIINSSYPTSADAERHFNNSTPLYPFHDEIPLKRENGKNFTVILAYVIGVALLILVIVVLVITVFKKCPLGKVNKTGIRSNISTSQGDIEMQTSFPDADAEQNNQSGYARVDFSKKRRHRKKDECPIYAQVDKSKKKRPGQIIYAELKDFKQSQEIPSVILRTSHSATVYADIQSLPSQKDPDPIYETLPNTTE